MVETSALTGLERAEPSREVMLRAKWTRQRCQAAPGRIALTAARMPACASLVTRTTPVGSSGEGTLSPRSRRDRKTRTSRSRPSRRPPGPCPGSPGGLRPTRRWPPPAPGRPPGAPRARPGTWRRRTGRGTRCGPGGGTGTRARPRRSPCRSARPWTWRSPTRCPGPAPGRRPCGWRPPRSRRSRSRRIWALSTRRRGWSREGKNDPVRSLGIASSTSPAVVATVLGLVPLRRLVRCGVRDVALRADHGGGLGVDQVLQPGLEQTPEDARLARSGSARTSRISVDTAHWFVAGIVGALLVNLGRGTGLPRCPHPCRRPRAEAPRELPPH